MVGWFLEPGFVDRTAPLEAAVDLIRPARDRGTMRHRRALVVGLLLCVVATVGLAGPAGAAPQANATGELAVTYDVDLLAEQPDRIELAVEARLENASADALGRYVLSLEGSNLSVLDRDGMGRQGDRLTWDGTDERASIRVRYDPTVENEGFGGLDFGAGETWALLLMDAAVSGEVGLSESVAPVGYRGETMTLVGEYERYSRATHGQTVELVVPAAAELAASPSTVLDSLGYHSRRLRVGSRGATVTAFVTTDPIRGGGLARGSEVWVSAGSSVAGNTWGHEYVHTRQDRAVARETEWLTEAEATYFETLFAWEQGHIDGGFEALQRALAIDGLEATVHENVSLAEPDTWAYRSEYDKGALVLFALDARIRAASGGARTYQDVMRRLNAGTVDGEDFRETVADVAGRSMDGFLDRHVGAAGMPDVPSEERWFVGSRDADVAYDVNVSLAQALPSAVRGVGVVAGRPVELTARIEHVGTDPGVAPRVSVALPDGWRVVDGVDGSDSESVDETGSLVGANGSMVARELAPGAVVRRSVTVVPNGSTAGGNGSGKVSADGSGTISTNGSVASNGSVTVSVTDADRYGASVRESVSVAESLSVDITGDGTVVRANESVRLAASVNGTIERVGWDLDGNGTIDAWTEGAWLNRSMGPGVRTVTAYVVGADGRVGIERADIVVNDRPRVELVPAERLYEVAPGTAVELRLVAVHNREVPPAAELPDGVLVANVSDGVGDHAVSWTFPDGTVLVGTARSSLVESVVPAGEEAGVVASLTKGSVEIPHRVALSGGVTEVEVVVVDEYGAGRERTLRLAVPDRPALSVSGPSVLGANETGTFRANVSSSVGNVSVSWLLPNGSTVEGRVLERGFGVGSRVIRVVAEDEYGTRVSQDVEMVVNDRPGVSVEVPETVRPGERVPFDAAVSNDVGNVTVRWTFPDGAARGRVVQRVLSAGEHEVVVRVEDEYGAVVERSVNVTVRREGTASGDGTGVSVPGFGVGVGVVAVVWLVVRRWVFTRR